MDKSGGNDDSGTEVLDKVEKLSIDRETRDTSCDDREKGGKRGCGPDDEDGADAKTGGAGTVVGGTCALNLLHCGVADGRCYSVDWKGVL